MHRWARVVSVCAVGNRAYRGLRGLSAGSEVCAVGTAPTRARVVRSLSTRARAVACAVGNRAYQGPREGNLPIVREDVFIRPIKTYASHAGPLSNAGEPASPRRVASFPVTSNVSRSCAASLARVTADGWKGAAPDVHLALCDDRGDFAEHPRPVIALHANFAPDRCHVGGPRSAFRAISR